MKIYVVAEVRENHKSILGEAQLYNDYVSKKSMDELVSTLQSIGYDCEFFGGVSELHKAYLNKEDFSNAIFINYNYGLPAAFKRAQSPILLELLQTSYSGADPFVALLVNDKEFTKKVVSNIVHTPKSLLISNSTELQENYLLENLSFPVVVKPNGEGSSLGIDKDSLCYDYEQTQHVCINRLKEYDDVLIEEYIPGYECTVWVIGNPENYRLVAPLLISYNGEYIFTNKIFTMDDKANHVRQYHNPKNLISDYVIDDLIDKSKSIFQELRMHDYARFDFRINNDNIYFIEANALPIFSKSSEIGNIEKIYNVSYPEICKNLVETILERLMT